MTEKQKYMKEESIMASEFTFEITKHIGVIKAYETGWSKEINIVSWNGGQPKVDIRDWDENHERMSRGVTLTKDEFRKMVELTKERMPSLTEPGFERDAR